MCDDGSSKSAKGVWRRLQNIARMRENRTKEKTIIFSHTGERWRIFLAQSSVQSQTNYHFIATFRRVLTSTESRCKVVQIISIVHKSEDAHKTFILKLVNTKSFYGQSNFTAVTTFNLTTVYLLQLYLVQKSIEKWSKVYICRKYQNKKQCIVCRIKKKPLKWLNLLQFIASWYIDDVGWAFTQKSCKFADGKPFAR